MSHKEMEHEMRRLINEAKHSRFPSCENDFSRNCLHECIERKYITGIFSDLSADGKPHFEIVSPRITPEGFEYLERKNPNRRANISIAISIIALIIALLSNLGSIIESIEFLLNIF